MSPLSHAKFAEKQLTPSQEEETRTAFAQLGIVDDAKPRRPTERKPSVSHNTREAPKVGDSLIQGLAIARKIQPPASMPLGNAGTIEGHHQTPKKERSASRTQSHNHPVYPPIRSLTTTTFSVLGYNLDITPKEINQWRIQRLQTTSIGDYLHDLMSASFVPLSSYATDQDCIRYQASQFLSAFDDSDASWEINVESLPIKQGEIIYGTTDGSRETSIKARFLRFRFPHIRFEWHIETPYSELNQIYLSRKSTAFPGLENIKIEVLWKAWARRGPFANLVAYGSCTDTLIIFPGDRSFIIKKRIFTVINVLHPESMTPLEYPLTHPPLQRNDDVLVFSTSQTMIQYLHSSQRAMSALAALSALFASLQPIIDRKSRIGGLILAGIGITAATISVFSLVVDWMLKWIEANAAKNRQQRK
ncbi:hypothetical protein BDQ12DRAFT_727355 [Crucibulum laeve]|uniref:Uncharacterized protein n=1 Tax=Crucibulum laeve TaxID=68775 RepID=A0A5C3LNP0_9AGAR|nr:hypothetical protein BDQ12DRAFT_727355 [Crucibulum laeve]